VECGAGPNDGINSSSRSGVNERPTESVILFSRGMTSCNFRQNEFWGVVPWWLQLVVVARAHRQRRVTRLQSDKGLLRSEWISGRRLEKDLN
jgi:hypothetical protein